MLPCSSQLLRYCKMLGGVDRFNKMLVATRMGVGKCKQRYQRALFLGWLLPAMGVINVRIAFNHIWPSCCLARYFPQLSCVEPTGGRTWCNEHKFSPTQRI